MVTILKWVFVIASLIYIATCSVNAQHWVDSVKVRDYNVRKSDSLDWVHMDKPHKGSYNKDINAWLEYSATAYQYEIWTEGYSHHSGFIVEVLGISHVSNNRLVHYDNPIVVDTVITKSETPRANYRAWFWTFPIQDSRTIRIRALDNKHFVINKIVKWVSHDPNYSTICEDSLRNIVIGDTIHLPDVIIPGDTTYLPNIIIPGDTIYEADIIIPGDSIFQPDIIVPGDTVKLPDVIIPADTIYGEQNGDLCLPCIEPPPCPPSEGDKEIPIWIWIIIFSLVVTIIVLLATRNKNTPLE